MHNFPKIWFLRHGETAWNAEQRVQGQLESDLTEQGRGQARLQARLLAPILEAEIPLCLVSPLRRAQDTARLALGERPYTTDVRLAEIMAGDFQGQTLTDIARTHPALRAANQTALDLFCAGPGGEGYDAFYDRVMAVLSSLDRPTVIVAHGLWGQVLRGIICGLDRENLARLPNEQGCIYVLENGSEHVLKSV